MSGNTYKSRTALVTGAGRRIGRAVALGLANGGWDVGVHFHRSRSQAEELVREIETLGRKATAIPCDLALAGDTSRLIAQCASTLGPVSCLVNNAALFEYDDLATLEAPALARHLDINLRAPLLLAKAFAAQAPAGADSCIINMLDQKVYNLNPDFFSYTLAKIGLEGATRMLALALAPRIRVCGVAPGITLRSGEQTEEGFARAHRMAPLGHSSALQDLVDTVCFLAGAKSITGETILVDGGQHLWKLQRDVQFETGKN
ncbi:MAG: SDR family oxidoreductase [Burkholderiales bacterium]